ncbi:unnamed protein product, partial [Didymodactylos carnosus]
FREFLRVVSVSQGTDEKAKLELAYKAYNRNNSDTLNRKEFQQAVHAILDLIETRENNGEENVHKRDDTLQWAMKKLSLDEKDDIAKKEFVRRCTKDEKLYEFLAFHSVPKPNCSDSNLNGKEKWKIAVKTGSEGKKIIRGAGTDANVYLKLVGEQGSTEPIQLQHSQTHKNMFENGNTDVFTMFLPVVGKVRGATLWHTGNKDQGWFVDTLTVENESTNTQTHFPVQRWLDLDQFDGKTKVDLVPNQPPGYTPK